MGHAASKLERLEFAKRLYFLEPDGVTDADLARRLGVDHATAYRYRVELHAVRVRAGAYTLVPTRDDVALARAILSRSRGPSREPAGRGS